MLIGRKYTVGVAKSEVKVTKHIHGRLNEMEVT